jgi:predicted ester cyclase
METNAILAKRWFDEVWGQRKTDLVHDLVESDAVWHAAHGDFVGRQAFLDFHAGIFRTLPDLRVTVEAMISQGDHVVTRWLLTAKHGGKPLSYRGMTWVRFSDGKMVEGFDCWNNDGFMRQLEDSPIGP